MFGPKDVSPIAVHYFPGSEAAGMYTRSKLSSFWDSILINAASRNALKFSQKLILFSNNNKSPDSFTDYAPRTDFYVDNIISPTYFKGRFMDTFGTVAYVLEHCGIYFAVFLVFKLIICVVVMVIRHLEITEMTGASLGLGNTLLSASYNVFLMSVSTSMFDPHALTLAVVEEKRKTLYNEEGLNDMREDTKKEEEHIDPVMSPAQLNQAVTPISPVYICFNSFSELPYTPCDDCFSVLFDPEKDSQSFTPSRSDLSSNPVVTFFSPISSPSKVPSNPASPDETPASLSQSTNNPTTTISDAAFFPSTALQFSFSISENDQSQTAEERLPFSSLLSDVQPRLSRPNQLKFQPDHSILGRQQRREYYTNHTRRTRRPRFNQHL